MKFRLPAYTLLLVSILAFPCREASALGLRWEAVTTGTAVDARPNDHFYYMPGMLKMIEGEKGRWVIIRLDREMMLMGDPGEQSYYEMTFAEMEKMMDSASKVMDAQMKAMKEQLAALPEEQRKMAEEMMGSRMKLAEPKVEVSKTGESKTVNGFPCTKYVVKEDGKMSRTVWATTEIPGYAGMREDMLAFAKRMKEMMKGMADAQTGLTEGVDGFPVVTESEGMRTEVTEIEEASIPEAEFEAPQGYTKEEMPSMEMPEGY